MNELPKQSAPARFYELRLKLDFASDQAKERLITAIRSAADGVELAAVMLKLNESAKITFPKATKLPLALKDIRDVDEEDVSNMVTGHRVDLSVTTDDAWWVMDFVENEPVRLHPHAS